MKLSKTTAAILALGAFAGAAHAQSSVTLYGIVDAGILFKNNAAGHTQYSESQAVSSRWGLRGSEDLGGGLSAIFNLENGYTTGTGGLSQGGLEFGRKAFVGLSSAQYGTVTLGRQYSVSNDLDAAYASGADWAASGLGYGTQAGDVDNVDTTNRVQNSIKYMSPNIAGFQVGALYSLGGQAGNFTKNQVMDIAAGYSNGPLKLGAGYFFVKNPFAALWYDQGSSEGPITNPIYSNYFSAGSQQVITAGGSYAIGPATVGLFYANTQFGNLGTNPSVAAPNGAASGLAGAKYTNGSATFNTGEVNVKYNLTPAVQLDAAYIFTHNSGADGFGGAKYNQFNLGAFYNLSKRSQLYAIGFYELASGTDSTGKAAVADLGGTASSNNKQVAAIVGITHKF